MKGILPRRRAYYPRWGLERPAVSSTRPPHNGDGPAPRMGRGVARERRGEGGRWCHCLCWSVSGGLKCPGGQPLPRRVATAPEGSHCPGGQPLPMKGTMPPAGGSHRTAPAQPARAGWGAVHNAADVRGNAYADNGTSPSPRMGGRPLGGGGGGSPEALRPSWVGATARHAPPASQRSPHSSAGRATSRGAGCHPTWSRRRYDRTSGDRNIG